MDYTQCLDKLTSLGHELRGAKFDLKAIQAVLAALGSPHTKYLTAIVSGTNGKGSTAAMLANILSKAGYRTGLYTSPHLVRVNERIRIGADDISDADFATCFSEAWQAADRLLEGKRLDHRPSFFEFLTATAFLHFARSLVDFAVLEVGMGGRLDATNVTEPRVAVITNVDLDHEQFLGDTRAAIAGEKAGVIKARCPVISGCENTDAAEVIRRRAGELDAPLLELPKAAQLHRIRSVGGQYLFDLSLGDMRFAALTSVGMGRFQMMNAVAAAAAALRLSQDGLNIPRTAIVEGIRSASWPGRLDAVLAHPLVVLDGAHNPAAAREIAAHAKAHWQGRKLRLVYASMRDKAIKEISEILFPLADELILTRPEHARAATPEEILAAARHRPARIVLELDPVRALQSTCRDSSAEDVVLATGSLFLVGAILEAISEKRLKMGSLTKRTTISRSR